VFGFVCGEAKHEDGNLEPPVSFDHAEFLGVLFEKLGGKTV